MSVKYALRVDVVDDAVRPGLKRFLDKLAIAYIVAYEVAEGDNRHVHAIIDADVDIKKLRNAVRTYLPQCSGNKAYSLKVCNDDWESYMRYICKGSSKDEEPTIWYRMGLEYTMENILEAWSRYWVTNGALKANAAKRAKVEKANIVEQLEKICKDKGVKAFDREGIARQYIALFVAARKGINVFAARACVNTVSCLLDNPDCSETTLAQTIAQL